MRRGLLRGLVGIIAVALCGLPTATSMETRQVNRQAPNVVLIMIDDATVEDVEHMPNVQRLLVQQGTTFTRAYSPYPLCCPARATALTGQYAHNHRVLDNVAPLGGASVFDDSKTIATYLTDDYDTAIVGKYLNDFDRYRYVAPGWDTWRVPVNETTMNFEHQTMSFNGRLREFDRFSTRHHGRLVRDFIDQTGRPYFAFASFVAPHVGDPHESPDDPRPSAYVAEKYRGTYDGPPFPSDPTFNEPDVSDKRPAVADQPPLTEAQVQEIGVKLAQRRESLRSVDDQVALIVDHVAAAGDLENTYFIFTSDNGLMQGQHRIAGGKSAAYEPAARVPLIVRGPGIAAGAAYGDLVGLQDLTPTILSMTGQWADQPVAQIDGVSLLDLLAGQTSERAQVIESVQGARLTDLQVEKGAHPSREESQQLAAGGVDWEMRGIVTSDGWKYTVYPQTQEVEMYDLNADPFEEQNLAGATGYGEQQTRLHRLFRQYRSCDASECR